MDHVYYKCKTCGFTHQVPSYWSGFDPDQMMEMPHLNLETKEMCTDFELHLMEETD